MDVSVWFQFQFVSVVFVYQQYCCCVIGKGGRGICCYCIGYWVKCWFKCGQCFDGGFWVDYFVIVKGFEYVIGIVVVGGDNFCFECVGLGCGSGMSVRVCGELILYFVVNIVQMCQYFCSQFYYFCCFCYVVVEVWMEIDVMVYWYMVYVFDVVNQVDVGIVGYDYMGCIVQCLYGRIVQMVDCICWY